jgi:hypothetical protein
VSHDPGLRIFDWDESNVLVHHGPGTDFDTFIGAVCAAFGV